jgi:hypothetical protein
MEMSIDLSFGLLGAAGLGLKMNFDGGMSVGYNPLTHHLLHADYPLFTSSNRDLKLTNTTYVKPEYYRDTAAHYRWRNYQHAMARITASNLIYCAAFNALQDLTPPDKRHTKGSLEYDIVAAAQWVIWPVECRYVYQECVKKETTVHYWEPWSKEAWSRWKMEFRRVVETEQYNHRTKNVARQALHQMQDVEEEVGEEGSEGSGTDLD